MGKNFKSASNSYIDKQFKAKSEPDQFEASPNQAPITEHKDVTETQAAIQEPKHTSNSSDGWEQMEKKQQRYNKHINLMVQEFTRDKLDEYARADNKSRNDLINTILKEYINKRG